MNKYELAVIIKANLDEEERKVEAEKIQNLITRFDGVIDKVEDWGKRRLAYEIDKNTEGYYSFYTFSAEGGAPAEIESRIRIQENVIRYLIIRQ